MSVDTALHQAAKGGDTEEAAKLLDAFDEKVKEGSRDLKPIVDEADCTGWTPLHWAASRGRDDMVKLLLDRNATLSIVTHDNWSAVHDAARKGSEPVLRLLKDAGADMTIKTVNGTTPLHLAAQNGRPEAVNYLVGLDGLDISDTNNLGHSALHLAARNGHESVVQSLIDARANILPTDRIGRTAEMLADTGGFPAVSELLKAGAEEQRSGVINAGELALSAAEEATAFGDAAAAKEKYEEAASCFAMAGEDERAAAALKSAGEIKTEAKDKK